MKIHKHTKNSYFLIILSALSLYPCGCFASDFGEGLSVGIKFLIIFAVIVLIGVSALIGRKLLNYKATAMKHDEEDLLEELRNLQSIKVNLVSSKEIYSALGGYMLMFFAYYLGICFIGAIISGDILIGISFSAILLPFYLAFALSMFWDLTFFLKSIIPNLKHKDAILKKIWKFIKVVAFVMVTPIWVSAAIHIDGNSGMSVGLFISLFLTAAGTNVAISFELERMGLPNLVEGIKDLLKNRNAAPSGNVTPASNVPSNSAPSTSRDTSSKN